MVKMRIKLHQNSERARTILGQLISAGAKTLFDQHRYTNGYTSLGKSSLPERAVVIHVAAAALKERHAVWPESPFRNNRKGASKHLDLFIDLNPGHSDKLRLALIEAKRILPGEWRKKLKLLRKDCKRIQSWDKLRVKGIPLFYGLSIDVKVSERAIIVVLPQERFSKPGTTHPESFPEWWKTLEHPPAGVPKKSLNKLGDLLKSAKERNGLGSHPEGGTQTVVLYAIFS